MQIEVSIFAKPVDKPVQGPPPSGEGKRFVFSFDLVLERIDNNTPGNGLPQNPQQRRAGTYSGIVTTLRVAKASDNFFPPGTELFEYQSVYKFNAVPNTPLQKGQVTEHGVIILDSNFNTLEPKTFAITGGTDAYATARGQITAPGETGASSQRRLLDIL